MKTLQTWFSKQSLLVRALIVLLVLLVFVVCVFLGWKAILAAVSGAGGATGALKVYLDNVNARQKAEEEARKADWKYKTTVIQIDENLQKRLAEAKAKEKADGHIPAGISDDDLVGGLNRDASEYNKRKDDK